MSNLVLDFGNTRTKLALYKVDKLESLQIFDQLSLKGLLDALVTHAVQRTIFSVTGNPQPEVLEFLKRELLAIEMSSLTPVPIKNLYKTPETLGKDRLAAVLGAHALFPKENCLVVDAGTCITYDWLSRHGEYLGGNIAPGLRMRLQAMHHFTSKLPLVAPSEEQPGAVGYSTESAIQFGAAYGMLQEVKGYARWGQKHFGPVKTVLTGGDAEFFGSYLKRKIFVRPDLVLFGLNKILQFNVN
jgi:type III pantothenate kinase